MLRGGAEQSRAHSTTALIRACGSKAWVIRVQAHEQDLRLRKVSQNVRWLRFGRAGHKKRFVERRAVLTSFFKSLRL